MQEFNPYTKLGKDLHLNKKSNKEDKTKMDLKEFRKEYMSKSCRWDWSKFNIICKKCNSKKVEFNGYLESESGYYGEHTLEGAIIVKCHNCGNAFKIDDLEYTGELNKGGEKSIKKLI